MTRHVYSMSVTLHSEELSVALFREKNSVRVAVNQAQFRDLESAAALERECAQTLVPHVGLKLDDQRIARMAAEVHLLLRNAVNSGLLTHTCGLWIWSENK